MKMISFTRALTAIAAGVLLTTAGSAQAVVSFDWDFIGHAGNAPFFDGAPIGAVAYEYQAASHEVAVDQYVEFLNAVAATDTNDLYFLDGNGNGMDIVRSGASGSYTYAPVAGRDLHAIDYVSWVNAARFVNWMENGQPTGAQGPATTEDGVYLVTNGGTEVRAAGANHFLPNQNEWFKAAYHNNGGLAATDYFTYGTGSDTLPLSDVPPGVPNTANYGGNCATCSAPFDTLPVGSYLSTPPCSTTGID